MKVSFEVPEAGALFGAEAVIQIPPEKIDVDGQTYRRVEGRAIDNVRQLTKTGAKFILMMDRAKTVYIENK